MGYQVKRKRIIREKYFTFITYEYRGLEYEVRYGNGWNVIPEREQHQDEQRKIDAILDNPVRNVFDPDVIWKKMEG